MGILHWCLSRYSSVWCQSHESIHQSEIQFEVTNKGHIDEYLGLKVDSRHDWSMKLSQPWLTQQILVEMEFNQQTKGRTAPAFSSQILEHDVDGEKVHHL